MQKLVCEFNVPSSEIAILTPYTAQKEAINEKLQRRKEQQKKKKDRKVLGDIPVKIITESQGRVFIKILYQWAIMMHLTDIQCHIHSMQKRALK